MLCLGFAAKASPAAGAGVSPYRGQNHLKSFSSSPANIHAKEFLDL